MRTLAWILGLIAFCGTVFLGFSAFVAHRGVQSAIAAVAKAKGELSSWQMSAELEAQTDRSIVENDELVLQGDDLDVRIAGLEGKSASKAHQKSNSDRMKLTMDENAERMGELSRSLGPDPHVASAIENVQASQQSLGVYSAVLLRDEHLGYAAGIVWLAFGFAAALAHQKRV